MPSHRFSTVILAISLALTGCTHARVIGDAISPFHSESVLWTVQTDEKAIAITIDDGPDARETPLILDALERHGARATFFIVSDHVAGNEELLRRIVREGHELGNHLTNQEPSISLPGEECERRLIESHGILSSFGPVRWFRPGSAWYDEEMLAILDRHHYRCVVGRVYPLDGEIDSLDFASRLIRWMAGSGSIVLLHDAEGRGERAARILDTALPALSRSGYRFLTLSELVETAAQE